MTPVSAGQHRKARVDPMALERDLHDAADMRLVQLFANPVGHLALASDEADERTVHRLELSHLDHVLKLDTGRARRRWKSRPGSSGGRSSSSLSQAWGARIPGSTGRIDRQRTRRKCDRTARGTLSALTKWERDEHLRLRSVPCPGQGACGKSRWRGERAGAAAFPSLQQLISPQSAAREMAMAFCSCPPAPEGGALSTSLPDPIRRRDRGGALHP